MIALQRIRSLGISWSCSAMNWNSDYLLASRNDRLFSLGWWIEQEVLSPLFGFFYDGSDEEIRDAINGDIPRRYMNERQREAGRATAFSNEPQWPNFYDEFLCRDCDDALLVIDETNLCASCRALHPEMLLENRK
jgi:hypothetical protein